MLKKKFRFFDILFFQILKKYKNGIENPAATSFREFNSLFEKKKKKFFQINPMAKSDVF